MAGQRLAWCCPIVIALGWTSGCGDSRPAPAGVEGLSPPLGAGGAGAVGFGSGNGGIGGGGSGAAALPAAGSGGMGAQAPSALSGRPLAILADPGGSGCADYYPEILRAEGISSFERVALSDLASLSKYSVALLPGTALDA